MLQPNLTMLVYFVMFFVLVAASIGDGRLWVQPSFCTIGQTLCIGLNICQLKYNGYDIISQECPK